MEQQVIDSVTLGGSVAPHDLSVWGLFLQADLIVKIVIFMLVLASIWCWTIIIDKVIRLRRLRGKANRFEEAMDELRPAARSGNADAEELLGVMYALGLGVERDPVRATARTPPPRRGGRCP